MKTISKALVVAITLFSTVNMQAQVTQPLESFSRISISRSTKLIIKTALNFSISAPTQLDLVNADYSQNGSRLIFKGNSSEPVTITAPEITQIDIAGNGDISSDGIFKTTELTLNISGNGNLNLNLDAESLELNVSGNCNGTLKGKATTVDLNIAGRLNIQADSMVISNCNASVSGLATFKGDIRDVLSTHISGKGNIYYVTLPAIVNNYDSGISKIGDASNSNKSSDTTKISLGGIDGPKIWFIISDHDEINLTRDKPRKSQFHWAGIELGWNNYLNADGKMAAPKGYDYLELRGGRSMFVNMNLFEGKVSLCHRHLMIGSGLGFSFHNYFFSNENQILLPDTTQLVVYQSEKTIVKNKLVADYLTIPLMLQYNTNKHNKKNFHITGGVVMNWNIGSHLKFKDDDGNKTKFYYDYNLRPLRFDARASIGFGGLNLFATYGLQSLFKGSTQPELTPLNFGITLAGW